MTSPNPGASPAVAPSTQLVRIAGWCAYASGIVSIFGIAFLLAFFTVGGLFGPLNDIAVVVHYALMIPIAVALQRTLEPFGPALSRAAMLLGIAGMLAVIILQTLLVIGALPFGRQIGTVVVAFLVVLVWFLVNGHLARSTDILPNSIWLHVLAGLYAGYPFWAFSLGRRLRQG